MTGLVFDVRHAVRSLLKSPALVLVSMLSLGLGIGANTVVFSALHDVYLFAPTVTNPDDVVIIEPGNSDQFSYLNYRDLRDSGILSGVTGYRRAVLMMRTGGRVQRVSGVAVTSNFFETLGILAWRGRTFTAGDSEPERQPRVAVLSYQYWRQHLHGDPETIGHSLNLNGEDFAVIGILPEGYRPVLPLAAPEIYVPVSALVLPNINARENGNALTALGRLKPRQTADQARAQLTSLGQALERNYPGQNEGLGRPVRMYALERALSEGAPEEVFLLPMMLQAIFGLVLLIACGNVAGLLLTRAAHRRRDIAVRVALGANRQRLIRGLIVESVLLALAGGGVGFVMALWLRSLLPVLLPPNAPQVLGPPNVVLAGFGLGLALVTGALCGIAPALKATRAGIMDEVQKGATSRTTGRLRLRHTFVVVQVAAAILLLVLSSLFLRSLIRLGTLDPGFDLDHGLVAEIHVRPDRMSPENAIQLAREAMARAIRVPGVTHASAAGIVPLGGDGSATTYEMGDRPGARGATTYINTVSPGYFETMGIALLRGRDFQPTDRQGSPPVVIVSETFAREHFPEGDALGQQIREPGDRGSVYEIVGITRDSKYRSIGGPPEALLYYAFLQRPNVSSQLRTLKIQIKTAGTPESLVHLVRQAVVSVDTSTVVEVEVDTLRQATSSEASIRRVVSLLLGAAGALGLLLAMIGLYGVVAFIVASRTTEFGIRMALGATPRQVIGRVVGHGLTLIALGLVIGVAASFLVSVPLAALLVGLSPADPWSLAATVLVSTLVGMVAMFVPARRAARVDPLVALRYE